MMSGYVVSGAERNSNNVMEEKKQHADNAHVGVSSTTLQVLSIALKATRVNHSVKLRRCIVQHKQQTQT